VGQICDLARLFALFRTLPLQPDTQNANMKLLTVLSKRRIVEFTKRHADAEIELKAWFAVARGAKWKNLFGVRAHFTDVDQVGRLLIFNIRRNAYRLIVKVDYRSKLLMVKELLTHKEYEKKAWTKWC